MDVSRRNFLGALSASVAAVLSFGGIAHGRSRLSRFLALPAVQIPGDGLAQLGWSAFYKYLYTDFEFSNLRGGRPTGRGTRLRLAAIENTDSRRKWRYGGEPKCFVLTFNSQSATGGSQLPQDTYAVDHFALGRFELFISEANFTEGVYVYTAVINRIVG